MIKIYCMLIYSSDKSFLPEFTSTKWGTSPFELMLGKVPATYNITLMMCNIYEMNIMQLHVVAKNNFPVSIMYIVPSRLKIKVDQTIKSPSELKQPRTYFSVVLIKKHKERMQV